jgi:hypothetical protein
VDMAALLLQKKLFWNFVFFLILLLLLLIIIIIIDRFCGLVVRVPNADPDVAGSIPSATRFSE